METSIDTLSRPQERTRHQSIGSVHLLATKWSLKWLHWPRHVQEQVTPPMLWSGASKRPAVLHVLTKRERERESQLSLCVCVEKDVNSISGSHFKRNKSVRKLLLFRTCCCASRLQAEREEPQSPLVRCTWMDKLWSPSGCGRLPTSKRLKPTCFACLPQGRFSHKHTQDIRSVMWSEQFVWMAPVCFRAVSSSARARSLWS